MKRVSFVPGFKYYVHIQNIRISVTTMPSLQLAADCHTLKPARRRCGGTLGRCRKVWGGRVTVERERGGQRAGEDELASFVNGNSWHPTT